jgi:hypothetical protein
MVVTRSKRTSALVIGEILAHWIICVPRIHICLNTLGAYLHNTHMIVVLIQILRVSPSRATYVVQRRG